MHVDDQERVLTALAADTEGKDSPSGPIHQVLRELLAEGKIIEFAEAYKEFRRQRPLNARTTLPQVIAKLWDYWGRHGLVVDHEGWLKHRPNWSNDLSAAILMPNVFAKLVQEMDDEIRIDYSKPVNEDLKLS